MWPITYKGSSIKVTANFSETIGARRWGYDVLRVLKRDNEHKHSILQNYSSKIKEKLRHYKIKTKNLFSGSGDMPWKGVLQVMKQNFNLNPHKIIKCTWKDN